MIQRKTRRSQMRQYYRDAAAYLAQHPFCQIAIVRNGLSEEQVIRENGLLRHEGRAIIVPLATQIHHRNKRDGDRLLDQRWWMSASRMQHEWLEANKSIARSIGLLLPIQADKDGKWGDGQSALPTPEFMRECAR